MDAAEFRANGHRLIEWIIDYHERLDALPVQSAVEPGEVAALLPERPGAPDGFDAVLADLDRVVVPGLTNWQHPGFFAWFPANTAYPAILATTSLHDTRVLVTEPAKWVARLRERARNALLTQAIATEEKLNETADDLLSVDELDACHPLAEARSHRSIPEPTSSRAHSVRTGAGTPGIRSTSGSCRSATPERATAVASSSRPRSQRPS